MADEEQRPLMSWGAERTRAMRSQKEWVDTHGATNAIRSMDDGSTDGKLRSERTIR